MKLISLNAWGGRLFEPLIELIKQTSPDTDIYCFQEIFSTASKVKENSGCRTNLYQELTNLLKDHQGYFAPVQENYLVGSFEKTFTNFPLSSGQAIFIRKNIKVLASGDFFVFGQKNSLDPNIRSSVPRTVQFLKLETTIPLTVCNLHGIWTKTKDDTQSRIKQSEMVLDFLKKQSRESIVCGDFNLNPDTESIAMLEEKLKNLIKIYKIPTTRNKFSPKFQENKFADYIFVSNGIKVKDFQVPNVNISDHLPMILEFS